MSKAASSSYQNGEDFIMKTHSWTTAFVGALNDTAIVYLHNWNVWNDRVKIEQSFQQVSRTKVTPPWVCDSSLAKRSAERLCIAKSCPYKCDWAWTTNAHQGCWHYPLVWEIFLHVYNFSVQIPMFILSLWHETLNMCRWGEIPQL